MATHAVFTKEEQQKVKMSDDTIKFYSSNPDALKELILEREYFKAISELQQQRINDFTTRFNKIMEQKIDSTGRTLWSYAYDKYYENLYTKLDWSSFAKF